MSEQEQKKSDTTNEPVKQVVPEFADRQAWEAKSRVEIRKEMEQLLLIWKNEELDKVRKEYEDVTRKGIQDLFEQWKAEQKPPSHEEIQQLLDQEYNEFNLSVVGPGESEDSEPQRKSFVIRELPQAAEIKFYKQFKAKIQDKISVLQAFDQEHMGSFEDKVKAMIGLVDEGFDVLSSTVAIILDPYGKKVYIDKDWVQNNISTSRQWNILEAQIRVNKLKDFFSKLSLSGQRLMTTMTGPSFPQLQQPVR